MRDNKVFQQAKHVQRLREGHLFVCVAVRQDVDAQRVKMGGESYLSQLFVACLRLKRWFFLDVSPTNPSQIARNKGFDRK